MFLAFYPGEEERAQIFAEAVSGKDISMAELQGYFMIHKHRYSYSSDTTIFPFLSVADAFDDGNYLFERKRSHDIEQNYSRNMLWKVIITNVI